MSKVKNSGTKPEIIVRKRLFHLGYRYKTNDRSLVGTPDIVLSKYKIIIQVHGCFWHGHDGCKDFKLPKTRREWWKQKIEKNKQRDVFVNIELTKSVLGIFLL